MIYKIADLTSVIQTRTASVHSSGVPRVGPAALPRYGWGCRSKPRPAKRRRRSCRPIDGRMSSMGLFGHRWYSTARLAWSHLSFWPILDWGLLLDYVQGKGQSFMDCSPRTRGQGGACTALSAPRHPARNTSEGPGRRGGINFLRAR